MTTVPSELSHTKMGPNSIQDLQLAQYIRDMDMPNAFHAKILMASNWNLQLIHQLATSTAGREVALFLTYGWPISFMDTHITTITSSNHKSAMACQEKVTSYICHASAKPPAFLSTTKSLCPYIPSSCGRNAVNGAVRL